MGRFQNIAGRAMYSHSIGLDKRPEHPSLWPELAPSGQRERVTLRDGQQPPTKGNGMPKKNSNEIHNHQVVLPQRSETVAILTLLVVFLLLLLVAAGTFAFVVVSPTP